MIDEKQIEEMAKDIYDIIPDLYFGSYDIYGSYRRMAERHYEQGYRKIPEGSVVLTEERNKIICDRFEQLERVQAELQELNAKYYNEAKDLRRKLKEARKETAREIIDMLVPPCEKCDENWHKGCLCLRATIAEKIAKEYDVEVEE